MIPVTFRPIGDDWPGERTPDGRRKSSPFGSTYSTTLDDLDRELHFLGAREVVLQVALEDREIRRDGMPRANSRPSWPGVIVAFESAQHGALRYATDRFTTWEANLRAIALGLEALRRVDRYGIADDGQQYTGWNALPAATVEPGHPTTREEAASVLLSVVYPGRVVDEVAAGDVLRRAELDVYVLRDLFRQAARRAHPDTGGDPHTFRRVQAARELLGVA